MDPIPELQRSIGFSTLQVLGLLQILNRANDTQMKGIFTRAVITGSITLSL
jgi:hypothetical protein